MNLLATAVKDRKATSSIMEHLVKIFHVDINGTMEGRLKSNCRFDILSVTSPYVYDPRLEYAQQTALHHIIKQGCLKGINKMIELGANASHQYGKDYKGSTMFEDAINLESKDDD